MRIAIVTNILTPYRSVFYRELSKQLSSKCGQLKVFVLTDSLPLRPWKYDELKATYTELVNGKKVFIRGEDYLFNPTINAKINDFQPDIIIAAGSWTYPTLWWLLFHKRKESKYVFWTESHNQRATQVGTRNAIIKWLKKTFYNRFDGFCVPGQYANETVDLLIGFKGARVNLPNLVDEQFYSEAIQMRKKKRELREQYGLSVNKRILFCPARLIAIKGIDVFLEHASVCENINSISFVIAGDGPERERIEAIARKYGLDVKLLGYCKQNQVRELYSLADVFWLPSLQDANPLTSIEAAFAGLPLFLSYYTGNAPELVKEMENGIVYDTINAESVKSAMSFIINANEEWIEKAGRLSYQIAQEGFKCETETSKLIEQLNQLAY